MTNIIISSQKIHFDDIKSSLTSLPENKILEAEGNSELVVVSKIVYQSGDHKVVGYSIEPKNISKQKLPCIIYNRGGEGEVGSIKPARLFLTLARMSLTGYIVLASQYSGNGGSEGIDEFGGSDIDDVLNLYEVLKENQKADLEHIGMYGFSRGGMMAYLALTNVSWIKTAVVVGSISNVSRLCENRPDIKEHTKRIFGDHEEEKQKRSATLWTEKFPKDTPLLIMHGACDWRVSPLDSLELSKKLLENNVPHRLVIFEGNDHQLTESKNEAENLMQKWFDDYLIHDKSLPETKPHGA